MVSVRRFYSIFCGLLIFSSQLLAFTPHNPTISEKGDEFNTFLQNGKVGLKNPQGQILIPAEYDAVGWSNGELSVVNNVTGFRLGEKWGLLNLQNNKITKAEFMEIVPAGGDLIVATKRIPNTVSMATGCINTGGKELIPFEYDGIKILSLRAVVFKKVRNDYRYGLVDLQNKAVIPLQFANVYPLGSLRFAVENFQHKTAIFTDDGKQISQFSIDSIATFRNDVAIFFENQKQGLITRTGEIKLPAIYQDVRVNDDGSVYARKPNTWTWVDPKTKNIRELLADSVAVVGENILLVKNGGLSQLTDLNFKPLSRTVMKSVGSFSKRNAIFTSTDGKYGVIASSGEVLVNAKYDFLKRSGSHFVGQTRTCTVLLDSVGRDLTQKLYQFIGDFNGYFFPAQLRGYWGGVDRNGKEILACAYDSLIQTLDDVVVVKFRGKYGVITANEQWLLSPSFGKFRLVAKDKYIQSSGGTTQLKSFKGDLIYFSENKLDFKNGYLWEHLTSGAIWKINLDGSVADRDVRPADVAQPFRESEGLIGIQRDGQYGFIDTRGRLRIANRYEGVKDFSENLAAIKIRGKWGFINHEDKIAIQPVYEDVSRFRDGYSIVRQKSFYGVIAKQGKVVVPVRYDTVIISGSEYFKVKQNGSWGVVDVKGNIIINSKFDDVTSLADGNFLVRRDGKFGVLNASGLSTMPLIYDQIQYHEKTKSFLTLRKSEWEHL